MSWEKNNDAHYALYKFVRNLHFAFANAGGQIASFEEVGEWNNAFVVGAVGASHAMTKDKARNIAYQFNVYVIDRWDCVYEEDCNLDKAVDDIGNALASPNSKVKDAGEAVDGVYNFPSERN